MASRILINDISDSQRDSLLEGFNSRGTAPQNILFQNDAGQVAYYPVTRANDPNYFWEPATGVTAAGLRLGIRDPDSVPESGTWDFLGGGDSTGSTDIPFDASAAALQTKLNANDAIFDGGGVTVVKTGPFSYEATFQVPGDKSLITRAGDPTKLFPDSNVSIVTSQHGGSGIYEKFTIKLVRRPDVFVSSWTEITPKGVTVTEIREGDGSNKAMFSIALTGYLYKGTFTFSGSGTIPFNATEEQFSSAWSGWTVSKTGDSSWTIEKDLVGAYSLTEGDFDLSAIGAYQGYLGTLSLGSSNLDNAFTAAGTDTITSVIQIRHSSETLLYGPITLTKDILSIAATGPINFNNGYQERDAATGDVVIGRDITVTRNIKLLPGDGIGATMVIGGPDGHSITFGDTLGSVCATIEDTGNFIVGSISGLSNGISMSGALSQSGSDVNVLGGGIRTAGSIQTGSTTTGAANTITITGTAITYEGSTADGFETSVVCTNPTADRTITIPDASGTLALLSTAQTWTGSQTFTNTIGVTSDTESSIVITTYNASPDNRSFINFYRARGTAASPADTQVGDTIGKLNWEGREGGGTRSYGSLALYQDADWSSGAVDSHIKISLSSGGTLAEKYRFTPDAALSTGVAVVTRSTGDTRYARAIETKTDTGDYGSGNFEGRQVINTFDNTFKIYAESAWRTITTW